MNARSRQAAKWLGIGAGAIFLVAFTGLSYVAGSPRDAYGMVRYALPHKHPGAVCVTAATLRTLVLRRLMV